MNFSDDTLALFAREVAKYPAEQKQSAVMACLAIVQHEQGHVSADAEDAVAAYLGMPPIAVHEVTTFYNMYNQQPVGHSSSTSAPTCRASCATVRWRWRTCARSWACSPMAPRPTASSRCSPANAWVRVPTRR